MVKWAGEWGNKEEEEKRKKMSEKKVFINFSQ